MKMHKIPAGNLCKMCGRTDYHYPECPNSILDEMSYHVDFDMERMQRALDGIRTTMPEEMTTEAFRDWLVEQAAKITNKPVIFIAAETLPIPDSIISLGARIHERLGTEYRVVIQKPRVPGDNRITFDLEETWLSRTMRELERPPRFRTWPAMRDIIMDSMSAFVPRETEAWQGKREPHIHKEQPVGRVADSMMSLLNRAKKKE